MRAWSGVREINRKGRRDLPFTFDLSLNLVTYKKIFHFFPLFNSLSLSLPTLTVISGCSKEELLNGLFPLLNFRESKEIKLMSKK